MVNNRVLRNILLLIFGGLSAGMIYLIVVTSLKSNLWEALPQLNSQPWFVTTIFDFYFNIMVISAWVIYKEKNLLMALLWIVSFVLLGSVTTCFYVFIQLWLWKPEESFETVLLRRV